MIRELFSIILRFALDGFSKSRQSDSVKTNNSFIPSDMLLSLRAKYRRAESKVALHANYDQSGRMDSSNSAFRGAAKRAFRRLRNRFIQESGLAGMEADMSFIAFLSK